MIKFLSSLVVPFGSGKVNISLQRNFVISLMDKLCILSLTELRMVIITLELGKMLLGTGV